MQSCTTFSYRMVSRGQGEKESQSCWKLLTNCERTLIILSIISLIIAIALFIVLVILHLNSNLVCYTPECVVSSSILLKTLDSQTKPCGNFTHFLCNRYENSDFDAADTFNQSSIIELSPQIHEFYETCTKSEEDSFILELVQRLGGWPLLAESQWDETGFHWLTFMPKLRNYGLKYDWFINFQMVQDGNQTNLLMIGPPFVQPPSNELLYYKTVALVAKQLGGSEGIALQRVQNVTDFENELAEISNQARNSNESVLETTVENYNFPWPEIDFVQVLNHLARGHARFTNETVIIDEAPSFLPDLKTLLMKTSRRTQADYIVWKIIESFLPFTSDSLREIYQNFSEIDTRENHCLLKTQEIFRGQIETHLIAQRFDEASLYLTYLQEMLNFILQEVDAARNESVLVIGKKEPEADLEFGTNSVIEVITRLKMKEDDAFYRCLAEMTADCQEKPDTYYDSTSGTFHLSSEYLKEDYLSQSESSFYNYARIGRIMGDFILQSQPDESSGNATTTGVELAYKAYAKWFQKYGMEKKLPALKYNPKQLFWIYWGLSYCGSNTTLDVANLTQFRQVFQC